MSLIAANCSAAYITAVNFSSSQSCLASMNDPNDIHGRPVTRAKNLFNKSLIQQFK